jgi:hypothetical protein
MSTTYHNEEDRKVALSYHLVLFVKNWSDLLFNIILIIYY